jgi:hypothetical protein
VTLPWIEPEGETKPMEKEGHYIYGIIGSAQDRIFGPIGIGSRGDEVLTIGDNDLCMVVSHHPLAKFTISRDHLIAHERVIEAVMKEFDSVLPVRFGTIASSADEIRNLLGRRCREFKNLLRDMDHKIELGVKGLWKDMKTIYKELARENKDILRATEEILNSRGKKNIKAKIEVGKLVEDALARKKEKVQDGVAETLSGISVDHKLNKTVGGEMFMNAAFLVDKGREKEFDNIMEELTDQYQSRIKFLYAGPLPVFNFVNVAIYPEEWEK